MEIKISYNGKYPNLCSGDLMVTINDIVYEFPSHCLCSGGSVDWQNDIVKTGHWTISDNDWPVSFPEDLETITLQAINEEIDLGCCRDCI